MTIAIVGGGICGLSLALNLHARGIAVPRLRGGAGGEGARRRHHAAAACDARVHRARPRRRAAARRHRERRELLLQPLRPAHLPGAARQGGGLPVPGSRHPSRQAASRALSRRARADRATASSTNHLCVGVEQDESGARAAVQGDDSGRALPPVAADDRDRLRRRELGGAQATGRRQRGVHRHQHLARRHPAQADPDRAQLPARRLDPHRQDRDLSDRRRRRRRRQPADQLDHRDQARHGRDERLEQAGRSRRLHLGLSELALRLARRGGADPQIRAHLRVSDGRQGPARRAGPSAA